MLIKQACFERAVLGIAQQAGWSTGGEDDFPQCIYQAKRGDKVYKCAAGHLFMDDVKVAEGNFNRYHMDFVRPELFENSAPDCMRNDVEFVRSMQAEVHDRPSRGPYHTDVLASAARDFARLNNLSTKFLDSEGFLKCA